MTDKDFRPEQRLSVRDMRGGEEIRQHFVLKSKELRKTRAGQNYLDLTVSDATGSVPGKMWSDTLRKCGQDFSPGDFVKIEGRVETYRERPQLVVDKIRRVEPGEVEDTGALVRTSAQDPDVLFAELEAIAATLEPASMAQLVSRILDAHAEAFKTVPAAQVVHHAYRGGLVEHVVAVTRKVEAILTLEKTVNRSIAVAGAILHDIGKIREFALTRPGRTPEGRLLGHVVLGLEMVRNAAREADCLDAEWLQEIEHIIVSHHGDAVFGAPVRPLTREAVLVHFCDNMDAKLKIVDEALQAADDEGFAPYNKWLEGRAFRGAPSEVQEEDNGGT